MNNLIHEGSFGEDKNGQKTIRVNYNGKDYVYTRGHASLSVFQGVEHSAEKNIYSGMDLEALEKLFINNS